MVPEVMIPLYKYVNTKTIEIPQRARILKATKQRIVGSYDTSISDCIILIMPE